MVLGLLIVLRLAWALLRDAYHLGEGEVVIDQQHLDQQGDGTVRLAATLRLATSAQRPGGGAGKTHGDSKVAHL